MGGDKKDGMFGYVPAPPGAEDPFDAPDDVDLAAGRPADRRPTDTFEEPFPETGVAEVATDPGHFDEIIPEERPVLQAAPVADPGATPAPAPAVDPRELARRLAEQARARSMAAQAAQTPLPQTEPQEPAKPRLAARAPMPQKAPEVRAEAPRVEVRPEPEAPRKTSLADRARRPMSAADAMKAAAESEERRKVEDSRREAERAEPKAEKKRKKAAAAAPTTDFASLVTRLAAGSQIRREVVVQNAVVFRALWQAHRARAASLGDLQLLVTASVLLDAADRVPAGCLVAAHVNVAGRDVALWADLERGAILAVADSPDIYLAGL